LKPVPALDTLAQLRKRTRNKFITNGLVYRLVDLKFSPLRKSYWNTFHCTRDLSQDGIQLSGHYCNNRWCNQCNRIRTAKLINGYGKQLKELYDPYFVTLTVPNCRAEDLKATIELMHKRFKQLRDRMRKAGTPVVGIRKLECTYNAERGDYHPHYHLIVSAEWIAWQVQNDWLAYWPGTAAAAQDCRPADETSINELFKYFTKLVTKQKGKSAAFHPESLDVIFQAMRGKRVFQPMGIEKVSEDIDKVITTEYEHLTPQYKRWVFDDKAGDYRDNAGGYLSGYRPSDTARALRGVADSMDWKALDEEFKAIRRFDQREYWAERTDFWEGKTERMERNRKLLDSILIE